MKFDANVTDVASLTVSGSPVMISGVGGISVSGSNLTKGSLNLVGSRGANVSISGKTITIDTPTVAGGISAVVQDTSPQLGGDLDAQSHDITSVGTETVNTSLTVSGVPVNIKGSRLRVVFANATNTTAMTWTNMPLAVTLLFGLTSTIQKADTTQFNEVRFLVNKAGTAGASGSALRLRYSTTFTTTATSYLDMTVVGSPNVATNNTNTFTDTGWQGLVSGAKGDIFLAVVGSGGDGTTDPILGSIVAEFR